MIYIYIIIAFLIIVFVYDRFIQKKHTILTNYPIIGYFRFFLEKLGGPIRQYLITNNREELPFNRSQRSWIYASAKKENNYQGFGSDSDFNAQGHIFIKNSLFPYKFSTNHMSKDYKPIVSCAKIIGQHRKKPFRVSSIVNISAMSYGALSPKAVESLNKGALRAGCYQNTGEGGLSPYHSNGADIIFQIGTGYFGVRNEDGSFSMDKLCELVSSNYFVRAIEIKLSQGAKPGHGGILPGKKVNADIARVRGVEIGKDVISPPYHSAFDGIKGLIDFVEEIANKTGLPCGFKAAVGQTEIWKELAIEMSISGRGPDFITIDCSSGGTGAAPISFTESVSLPFVEAFSRVYKIFKNQQLEEKTVFIASGKLGFPQNAIMAFAMGADAVNIAREALMSIGCIQSQICHTNRCPTGITTQNKWKQKGIDETIKSIRCANYIESLRKEVLEITHACGYEHPSQFKMSDVCLNTGDINGLKTLEEIFNYKKTEVSCL